MAVVLRIPVQVNSDLCFPYFAPHTRFFEIIFQLDPHAKLYTRHSGWLHGDNQLAPYPQRTNDSGEARKSLVFPITMYTYPRAVFASKTPNIQVAKPQL
jgi:hypothetical protein